MSDPRAFRTWAATTPGELGFLVLGALGSQAAHPELADAALLSDHLAARRDVATTECGLAVGAAFADDPPVLLWQGSDDPLTPAVMNARDATTRADVLAFVAARFAGEPPTSTCPPRAAR